MRRGVVSTATKRLVLEEEEWYGLVFYWLGMETYSITRGVVLTTAPRPALGKRKVTSRKSRKKSQL